MRPLTLALLAALAVLAPSIGAGAQTFVGAERDGLLAAMPAPPTDESLAGQADLEAVLIAQAQRSEVEAHAAAFDGDLGPRAWAAFNLGPDVRPDRYPLAFALFDAVRTDMTKVVDDVKAKGHQRPRPHQRDPLRVKPSLSIKGHGSNSWPSGRAAASRVWAGVLSDLFPEKAETLAAAAERTALLRVVGGVHYPSDLVAGKALADHFLRTLRGRPDYQRRLREARNEIERSDR